ncbi:hypothetical protein IAT40_001906 [Kwoniella sp. CBS 6097]
MTTDPFSTGGSGPSSPPPVSSSSLSPSPALIIQALKAQLLPTPLYPQLASSLQLLAHLHLLRCKIHKEAMAVLKLHRRLRKKLDELGYGDRHKVVLGILNQVEGEEVQVIHNTYEAKMRNGETLLALSLDLRKFYIAKLLSTPKMPIEKVKWMVDSYLPDIAGVNIVAHKTLYIRCMTSKEPGIYERYRGTVLDWCAKAEEHAKNKTAAPLEWTTLYPTDKHKDDSTTRQERLVDDILRAAQQIADDVQTLEQIFIHANPGNIIVNDDYIEIEKRKLREKREAKDVEYEDEHRSWTTGDKGKGNGKGKAKKFEHEPNDESQRGSDDVRDNERRIGGIFSSPAASSIISPQAVQASQPKAATNSPNSDHINGQSRTRSRLVHLTSSPPSLVPLVNRLENRGVQENDISSSDRAIPCRSFGSPRKSNAGPSRDAGGTGYATTANGEYTRVHQGHQNGSIAQPVTNDDEHLELVHKDKDKDEAGPSVDTRPAAKITTGVNEHLPNSDPNPIANRQTETPSNPRKRPRPRQSFPPTGPDYLASPSTSMIISTTKHTHTKRRSDASAATNDVGSNKTKERLRPFEDSELRAHTLKRHKT